MPKLNVQQTNANVIKAFQMALENTNPNLLDNPFFQVNQRQVANGVVINANGYVADRWQATGTNGATRNADGTITIGSTIFHKFPDLGITGKTVTISVMYADNTVESSTHLYNGTATYVLDLPSLGTSRLYTAANQINLSAPSGSSVTVKAVKLELGTVSTLANDVPPDYGTELAKCQRYFQRIHIPVNHPFASGFSQNTTSIRLFMPITVTLRAKPTMATSGTFFARGNGSDLSASSFQINTDYNPESFASFSCVVSGATTFQTYILMNTGSNAYIDLSADL